MSNFYYELPQVPAHSTPRVGIYAYDILDKIMNRLKLSKTQLGRVSEILGNVSVAWFSAGIISPIFVHPQTLFDFVFTFGVSLVLSVFFLILSLMLLKGVR